MSTMRGRSVDLARFVLATALFFTRTSDPIESELALAPLPSTLALGWKPEPPRAVQWPSQAWADVDALTPLSRLMLTKPEPPRAMHWSSQAWADLHDQDLIDLSRGWVDKHALMDDMIESKRDWESHRDRFIRYWEAEKKTSAFARWSEMTKNPNDWVMRQIGMTTVYTHIRQMFNETMVRPVTARKRENGCGCGCWCVEYIHAQHRFAGDYWYDSERVAVVEPKNPVALYRQPTTPYLA